MDNEGTAERPIEEWSLNDLYVRQMALGQMSIAVKQQIVDVVSELHRRMADSTKQAFVQASKTHGTMSFPLQDGLIAKADIKQTVTWDSPTLMELAKSMPWDRVQAMFKIKFELSETVYKGIAATNPALLAKVDEARTVKYSEPSIVLTRPEA